MDRYVAFSTAACCRSAIFSTEPPSSMKLVSRRAPSPTSLRLCADDATGWPAWLDLDQGGIAGRALPIEGAAVTSSGTATVI
jgi:hypothetical protein